MDKIKNKLFAAVVIAVLAFSGVCALAATPTPQPATATPAAENSENNTPAITVTTAAPAASQEADKNYTTKGGAFGWFVLSVVVNTVLSFAIGNRFYKMSKKDTHITSELRALRRDVEEKFAANVGGFSEPEMDIANSNDDYSSGTEGIKINGPAREETQESAEDIFRQWESRMAAQRAERRAAIREAVKPRSKQSTEDFVEGDERSDIHHRRSDSYRPRRDMYQEKIESDEDTQEDFSDEDFDEGDSKIDTIKSKAKELITDIFPFKDE
jgi:hypothetical protein